MDEQKKFLEDIQHDGVETDPFALLNDTPVKDDSETKDDSTATDDDNLKPRNRRERRLEAKLKAERESGIHLAARLEAITEAQKVRVDDSVDYLKSIERIYGTDTPESREATEILKQALLEVKETAKREAIEAYEGKADAERQAVKQAEETLDEMLEEIEDEFDVDLSSPSGEKARKDFFKLMEKMSPKDKNGDILYYADHISVWETYQEKLARKPDTTAKDLSVRSMTRGQGEGKANLVDTTNERFLRENGII